ncbi:NlpC/P60 family protein [Sphaerisporangium sp. TRM90804]|uniref:C40 family peptidase n=1 Tax=Sphaerisporangium sp. TRM90804 TaxID=3031113 RepID=UPI002448E9F1|nr:NlpC/P60 family protein [Sphaerisporangium sp. TRM90804]MDH2425873.1 NlpC/P60 family protein [Sphaerisporangium sp. TRM90804]
MGRHARPRERGPRALLGGGALRVPRRIAMVAVTLTAVTFGSPLVAATAEPKPSLNELKNQVERHYEEIESLTEQFNGQRERLKQARRSAELANKTLEKSHADLEQKRLKAGQYAQDAYMLGGIGSSLALAMSGDPDGYLNRAATTYALQMQQGEEVARIAKAMDVAERAKAGAKAREAEVNKLVSDLSTQRDKIRKLVAKTESTLFRRALSQAGNTGGRATKIDIPIPGDGKAAEATKWALTQQLKPYVWGAAGPSSFDCSGLVMWAYQKVGISLPHYTGDQWTAGTHVSRQDLRAGDLVFFYSDLHHVGIYIGGGMMVHAPRTGDVVRVVPLGNRPFVGGVRIAD